MTRYGGLGRTRPKKLTSKASIPIVREEDIDVIDDELQSTLQQIETGVEKAEESVSGPLPSPNFSLIPACDHVIASPKRHEIFTMLTLDAPRRNFTCKSRSMLRQRAMSMPRIFQPPKQSSVTFNMTNYTLHSSHNPRRTFASPPRWKIAADVRIT